LNLGDIQTSIFLNMLGFIENITALNVKYGFCLFQEQQNYDELTPFNPEDI